MEEDDGDCGEGRKKPVLEWGRGEVGEDGRNEEVRKAGWRGKKCAGGGREAIEGEQNKVFKISVKIFRFRTEML